ncbi:MAG TPA: hypothetical protein VLG37_04205 [Candidatus Saccharimonadales bacterium]|nr:hypothetical protein [Candidatus Saccharimonadales bacterium]
MSLECAVAESDVNDVFPSVNSGRKALLSLLVPKEPTWQLELYESCTGIIEEAASIEAGIPAGSAIGQGIIDLDKAKVIQRFDVKALDSLGRQVSRKRLMAGERWGLAVSLADNLAEISFGNRISLAALVGEASMRPNGTIDTSTIIARIAIFSDLIKASDGGDIITDVRRLAQAGGIQNARSHADDLVLTGILETAKTGLDDRYSLAEEQPPDVEGTIKGYAVTKPGVVELREFIIELIACGDKSVYDIIAAIEQNPGTSLAAFHNSMRPESMRRRINQELNRLERAGIAVKKFEPGTAFTITKNGLQIVHQYLHGLRQLVEASEADVEISASKAKADVLTKPERALWLAHCDYTGGKFRRAFTGQEKDEMIAGALAEGSLTPTAIRDKIGGVLDTQVIRRHLVDSLLFQTDPEVIGHSKVWCLATSQVAN